MLIPPSCPIGAIGEATPPPARTLPAGLEAGVVAEEVPVRVELQSPDRDTSRDGQEVVKLIPLYVYVFDVSSDGSISLLYPDVGGAQEELPPGESLTRVIETFVAEGRNAVVDVFKVLASTRAIDPRSSPREPCAARHARYPSLRILSNRSLPRRCEEGLEACSRSRSSRGSPTRFR